MAGRVAQIKTRAAKRLNYHHPPGRMCRARRSAARVGGWAAPVGVNDKWSR
jgi:hypothetical protein